MGPLWPTAAWQQGAPLPEKKGWVSNMVKPGKVLAFVVGAHVFQLRSGNLLRCLDPACESGLLQP